MTITLLPTPSLQRLNHDGWSVQSTAHPSAGPAQVHPRVSQPPPRSAAGTAKHHALAVILSTRGDFSPVAQKDPSSPCVLQLLLLAACLLLMLSAISP